MTRALRSVLALGAFVAVAASAAGAATKNVSAPADESFGPFGYTAISTRTKIDALGRSYHQRWADNASIEHDAGLVESSFHVWAQRYPHDPWLAPTAFHLAQLYAQIPTAQARAHALALYRYVAQSFGSTKEGRLARSRVQHGLPPVNAETAVHRTPSPYASRAPYASPGTSPSAAAAASNAPSSAAATVSPSPKPRA